MDTLTQERFSYTQFKQQLGKNKKALLLFSLLFMAAALLLSTISLTGSGRVARVVQVTGFLSLGCLLLMVLQKKLNELAGLHQAVYTVALSFIICGSIGLLFLLRGVRWPLMIAASTLSFLLPYIVAKAWAVYSTISVSRHGVWQYVEGSVSKQSVVSFNNIPIRIKFYSQVSAKTETVASFNAPIRMKLGTVFYHIIQQQNEGRGRKIEYTDKNGVPFYWEFYSLQAGGLTREFFNPDESLVENNIKPNVLIVAQRVTDQPLQHEPDHINETTTD